MIAKTSEELKALYGYRDIAVTRFTKSDGTPMPVYSGSDSPGMGLNVSGSEALVLKWEHDATPSTAAAQVCLPPDLDDEQDMVLSFLVSKTGATLADATTLTVGAFIIAEGGLYDADSDCGGVTGAVTGDAAAKTTKLLTRTIAAADIPSGAKVLNITVKPTAGTLGTDDFLLHAVELKYVRKNPGLTG